MTDLIPALSKIIGIPVPSLRSIAKLLGVPSPETPEDVAKLVALTHLQAYTSLEIALGILAGRSGTTAVAVINRSIVVFEDGAFDLQSGEPVDVENIDVIFEQHSIDTIEVASHVLDGISASSPAEPPQPPEAAGADPTASAPGSP